MMETEFRGKRQYDGKWIYGNLVVSEHGDRHIIPSKYFIEDGHHLRYEDDTDEPMFFNEETIGQWTGLFDSVGNKLYVGDIVDINSLSMHIKAEIRFSDGCFDVVANHCNFRDYLKCYVANHCVEVIGNIYDNPKLMEGNNDEH